VPGVCCLTNDTSLFSFITQPSGQWTQGQVIGCCKMNGACGKGGLGLVWVSIFGGRSQVMAH
jgi:hypothetical protein